MWPSHPLRLFRSGLLPWLRIARDHRFSRQETLPPPWLVAEALLLVKFECGLERGFK